MTIREIAALCGVSRGTVDRVLNGRGRVRPETEALVRHKLEEVGYAKNVAARALTVRRSAPRIGVLLSSEGNPFFDDVIAGVRQAEAELADYGVTVRLEAMRGYDTATQLARIDAMAGGLSALVVQPVNDPRVAALVAVLAERGIPTITVNSDLENSARVCYVGSDYRGGGRTAAGVVRLITGGRARLAILSGVDTVLGHVQREAAFVQRLRETAPGIQIVRRASARDDIEHAWNVTHALLEEDPSIDAVMVIAAGLEGVCRAVMELGMDVRVRLFAFDSIPITGEMMRRGLLKATVCQQPFEQGYRAVRAAYDTLLTGTPGSERIIMDSRITILENLPGEEA